MPRASTRATLDVRLRCERFSSLRKQDRIGALKSTARTIIVRMRIAPTSTTQTIMARMRIAPTSTAQTIMARIRTGPTSTVLKNIDMMTWAAETAGLRRMQEIE